MEATSVHTMTMTNAAPARRKVYFDGMEVEVWENPDAHFGATADDMRSFYEQGSWVALFNAMTLAATPDPRG